MSKVVSISQSNYIPWKGYFDMINMSDVFVLYDDMQYTRRDWRNRNKIKTQSGSAWLTIPVDVKGKYHQQINQTKVSDKEWNKKHWQRIVSEYKKHKFFAKYRDLFEDLYLVQLAGIDYLSEINRRILECVCGLLDINTKIMDSRQFTLADDRNQRLLSICKDLEADCYLSGPAAKDYMDVDLFNDSGVAVMWMDYSNYPSYEQMHGEFEHGVTILDLLFSCGPDSKKMMKSFI